MSSSPAVWTCPRCWSLEEGAVLGDGTRSALCSWCHEQVGREPPAEVVRALRLL